jgi:hypothetical protein
MAQQKVKIKIPKGFSPAERKEIAMDIISYIQDRALDKNKGYDPSTGKEIKLPKYTKSYADKKGVGVGDVDLALSTKMLNGIEVLNSTSDSVTIGFKAGSEENAKAEGNQKGTYGQPKPIPGKARPFLGLPEAALKRILKDHDGG